MLSKIDKIKIDKIYIISYTKNDISRQHIKEQLNYHGITDFEFIYTYNVSENIINNPHNLSIQHLSVSFTHYDIIKKSYELGLERILIFEDDVLFLQDKKLFNEVLNKGIESSADIYMYDYSKRNTNIENVYAFILTSGYMLNRNGMKFMIDNYENDPFIIDEYFYYDETNKYFIDNIYFNLNKNSFTLYIQNRNTTLKYADIHLCHQGPNYYVENDNINEDLYFKY